MAELVGAIASGIGIGTLVSQIGSSIIELKRSWDEIKEAPETVHDLIEEIEDFHSILADIKDDQARNPVSSLLFDGSTRTKCITLCQRASNKLGELVEDLRRDIEFSKGMRKKFISAKVVLRKDKLNRYEDKLGRAVQLLALSEQCYTRSLLQLQPDIIVSKLAETVKRSQLKLPPPTTEDVEPTCLEISIGKSHQQSESGDNSNHRCAPSLSGVQEESSRTAHLIKRKFIVSLRTPLILVNKIWEFQSMNARQGWDFKIRTYNIVPRHSLVFAYTKIGDIRGLQELFQNGLASPFDRNENGTTLLHSAVNPIMADSKSLEVCKFLLEQGAERELPAFKTTKTPFDVFIKKIFWLMNSVHDTYSVQRFIRRAAHLLLPDSEVNFQRLTSFRGTAEQFLFLQQEVCPSYYQESFAARVRVANAITRYTPKCSPVLFERALSPKPLDCNLQKYKYKHGYSLIHIIARTIADIAFRIYTAYAKDSILISSLQEWRNLLMKYIRAGCDCNAVSIRSGRTPLLEIVNVVLRISSSSPYYCDRLITLDLILKIFLEDLESSGINLVRYGEKEKDLLNHGVLNQEFRYISYIGKKLSEFPFYWIKVPKIWRLINFTYGLSSKDWRFCGSESTEGYVREFWYLIENPWEFIPGAWNENEYNGTDDDRSSFYFNSPEYGSDNED